MRFNVEMVTENRHKSALAKEMTPVRVDKENCTAFFTGSEGNIYSTSMEQCSCPDFAINGFGQPCKHMIRLAMELGVIPSTGMQTDIDSAYVKYHAGYVKEFVKSADIRKVISFARDFNSVCNGSSSLQMDVFSESMDLSCILDCPMFKEGRGGKVTIDKKWQKEAKNIESVIRNRLGSEVLIRIEDEKLIDYLTTE